MQATEVELKKIRKALDFGDQTLISKELDMNIHTLRAVLRGYRKNEKALAYVKQFIANKESN